MEQEAAYFRENSIIKSAFHENKNPLILMKEILRRQYYPIKNHMVKIHLNTLLDTDIKVISFHHHCV